MARLTVDRPSSSRGHPPLLLAVVACAALTRLLWYAGDIPRFWFAEASSIWIATAREQGHLWHQWWRLLAMTQVTASHESAILLPVALGFQTLLGPSLHLPTFVGAFWGVLAVVLAWRLGREVDSEAFGIVFAALVAASPLAIVWSRLGSVPIAATAHVLLVCWLGHAAGTRRSLGLATLAGVAAWASVYHHYSARVAMPLVLVALMLGAGRSRPRGGRLVALLAACGLVVIALWIVTRAVGNDAGLWPQYIGYVGYQGTPSLMELATDAVAAVGENLPTAARVYFWSGRAAEGWYGLAGRDETALTFGLAGGGLCLLPVALLGTLGLARAVRHPRASLPWIGLGVLGLLLPCLSLPSARRFLVFDVAWCALAADGLLALTGARRDPLRRVPVATAVALALGLYTFATIMILGARLPPHWGAVIPFGESGFGDGRTCLACVRHARRWEEAIRGNAFVVLFDSDIDAESRTSPAGEPLYGKIAALAAGRPQSFVNYYALLGNWDHDPPRGGPVHDGNAASYLAAEIERASPRDIRWVFPQPTQWERWLVERLLALGGERRTIDDPSYAPAAVGTSGAGIEVTTPPDRRAEALALVRDLSDLDPAPPSCLRAETLATERSPAPAFALAASRAGGADGPRWIVGSNRGVRVGGLEIPMDEVVALAVDGDAGAERLDVLTIHGARVRHELATGQSVGEPAPFPPPGTGCAARIAGEWWLADPIAGRVMRERPGRWTPPAGRWMALAGDPAGRLVLGAADQSIHVFDLAAELEVATFPARVPPSGRMHFAECSLLAAGDGWIATFDHFQRRLAVYEANGVQLGTVTLETIPPLPTLRPATLAATADTLGIGAGWEGVVATFRLEIAPDCRAKDDSGG